jgi:hypothetical protein
MQFIFLNIFNLQLVESKDAKPTGMEPTDVEGQLCRISENFGIIAHSV